MKIKIRDNTYPVFPQANDIYRVIAFVSTFIANTDNRSFGFLQQSITERQTHYYKAAAEYLGLMNKNIPTELAIDIFHMDKNEILVNIMKNILSIDCFYEYYISQNDDETVNFLITKYSYTKVTAHRRLSTIKAWCKWCRIIANENGIVID